MSKGAEYLDRMAESLMIQDVNFDEYLTTDEQAKIRDASTYRDDTRDYFLNPSQRMGYAMPWQKLNKVRIRKGEVSLWSGLNKSRKSMMQGYVNLGLVAQGAKCCVMSFEMHPVVTLARMLHQFHGTPEPTVKAMDEYFDFLGGNFWLYDQQGSVKAERVLAVARYAIQELGCDQIVIDSLMMCGIKKDNGWDRQIQFMNNLCTLVKDTGAHVHLVAHAKKPHETKKLGIPGRYDIKGAGELSDMAHNVYIVHKNDDEDANFNAEFIVDVQREGGDLPPFGFNFNEEHFQFLPHDKAAKMSADDWKNHRWN